MSLLLFIAIPAAGLVACLRLERYDFEEDDLPDEVPKARKKQSLSTTNQDESDDISSLIH